MKKFNNEDIDKLIKPKLNYVYFIINKEKSKIYVGETVNKDRIDMYKSIISSPLENKDIIKEGEVVDGYFEREELMKRNKRSINKNLWKDLIKLSEENSEVIYIKTQHNKYLERCYINILNYVCFGERLEYQIKLYNTHKYYNHYFDKDHINYKIIYYIFNEVENYHKTKN